MSTPAAPQQESAKRNGLATYLGLLVTLGGAVGAIVAALGNNDTATITSGGASVLVAVALMGGKYAQAVAAIKAAALAANPYIDAIQAALNAPSPEQAAKIADLAYDVGSTSRELDTAVEKLNEAKVAATPDAATLWRDSVAAVVEEARPPGLDVIGTDFDNAAHVPPDGDDAVHELTDGDPDAPVAVEPEQLTDEGESHPDPEDL